jgi:hypothetical protein
MREHPAADGRISLDKDEAPMAAVGRTRLPSTRKNATILG